MSVTFMIAFVISFAIGIYFIAMGISGIISKQINKESKK